MNKKLSPSHNSTKPALHIGYDEDLEALDRAFRDISDRYKSPWKREKRLMDSAIYHGLTKAEMRRLYRLWVIEQATSENEEVV